MAHCDNVQSKIQNLKPVLSTVAKQPEIKVSKIIWAEGESLPNLSSFSRHQLHPADTLIIWTAPPGHDIFQQVMSIVRPKQTFLIGKPAPFDTFPAFIKQLMGLVKYALRHKEGEVDLAELAAALGHRVITVRLGIDWLVAQGKLAIYVEEDGLLVLRPAQNPLTENVATIETILKTNLTETAAYRRFFREASLASFNKIISLS